VGVRAGRVDRVSGVRHSDSVMRAVLVAAFAGFPVVLVLAWVFDVTRGGIRVTEPIAEKYPQNVRPPRWWVRPLVAAAAARAHRRWDRLAVDLAACAHRRY
jgi:hypothetical protein